MKRKWLIIVLVISITLILLELPLLLNPTYNEKNAFNITKELSSDKYKGRLAGDPGNSLATNFIMTYFKSIGLVPVFKNHTYLQSFEVYTPSYNGNFKFQVYNGNNKIKEYKYGSDYKEITFGNVSPGSISGLSKLKRSGIGNILLINNEDITESTETYRQDHLLKKQGIDVLIYNVGRVTRFRTPYKLQISNNDGLVKLMVSEKVFQELNNFSTEKYSLRVTSPLEIKKVKVNNVVGLLKGKNQKLPPLILSFHLDHVGYDNDGVVYPGALDNASGAGFVMECAKALKHYTSDRNIIFAAFNAEEEGLLGSRYFVMHSPLNIANSSCINFDMISSIQNVPLTIMSSQDSKAYIKCLNKLIKNSSSEVEYEDSSDHASFTHFGINAATLIYDDEAKIHTPADNISNIDEKGFSQLFELLTPFLKSEGVKKRFTFGF